LAVNLYLDVVELIDLRSFSNLWYWIMLAIMWSRASHWVIGVPFDLVLRARRQGGALQSDVEAMVGIQSRRLLYFSAKMGMLPVAFLSFAVTCLSILAVVYDVEFAQAVLLLLLPMATLSAMSVRTARLITVTESTGDALHQRLSRHRFATQLLGILSIFVTAIFGMYQNLHTSVLG
jgi:hypothetical protein